MTAVCAELALVLGAALGAGPCRRACRAAVRAEFSGILCAACALPGRVLRLLCAAARAELAGALRAACTLPGAGRGRRILLCRLLLHLRAVGLAGRTHEVACRAHTDAHAHERLRTAALIAAGRFHTACDRTLDIALADRGIGEHSALIAHLDELFRLLVVGDAGDTDRLHLKAAHLLPVFIQLVCHVPGKLDRLGGDMRDTDVVHRHLVERRRERVEELGEILLVDVVDLHAVLVLRDGFLIEQDRVGDLDGICTVCAQEKLGVVEIVEIVDRIRRAELDALDLLQVDEIRLLCIGGRAAELEALPDILQRIAELPVEERGRAVVVNLVVAFLSGVVHDLTALDQHHELVGVNMDDRAVADDVLRSLLVGGAAALVNEDTARKDGRVAHFIRFDGVEPLVAERAADGAHCCFDKSHSEYLAVLKKLGVSCLYFNG